MTNLVEQMIRAYHPESLYDQKNAMKEVMQEIILCGLSRAGFFRKAAFYGGTALRIFYGLDRFSEDLDFSLLTADADFDLAVYFPTLEKEVKAFGLNVKIEKKIKTKESNIASAFLKGNTKEHLLYFFPGGQEFSAVSKAEIIRIKLQVDTNPPNFASYERKFKLQPVPYEVNLYDEASLFAGKVHAVLGRSWKNRVKGRDLYDYVFYLSRNIPLNKKHLVARLIQSGHLQESQDYSLEDIREMLKWRFEQIDYEQAKDDVRPFLRDDSKLNLWSAAFFTQITASLTEV